MAELKFQLRVPLLWVASMIAPASTCSMERSVALSAARPLVAPLATTDTTLAVTLSVRSTSTTDRVPLVATVALVSLMSAASLSDTPTVMTGVSLAPVIVTVSVALLVAPPLSRMV